MRDVLGYKLDQAGFLAAMPYLLMALIVQSAGVLADYARTKGRLTTTQVTGAECRGRILKQAETMEALASFLALNS